MARHKLTSRDALFAASVASVAAACAASAAVAPIVGGGWACAAAVSACFLVAQAAMAVERRLRRPTAARVRARGR
jgi:hypothetical protein